MLRHDRRGVVAVWIACAMPMFLICTALPIEVGQWTTTQIELQRSADLAALAGVATWKTLDDSKTVAICSATDDQKSDQSVTSAQQIALLNGNQNYTVHSVHDPVTKTIHVRLVRSVPHLLLPGAGITMAADSEATMQGPKPDCPLVGIDGRFAWLVK